MYFFFYRSNDQPKQDSFRSHNRLFLAVHADAKVAIATFITHQRTK